jgi:hypothetical protein
VLGNAPSVSLLRRLELSAPADQTPEKWLLSLIWPHLCEMQHHLSDGVMAALSGSSVTELVHDIF